MRNGLLAALFSTAVAGFAGQVAAPVAAAPAAASVSGASAAQSSGAQTGLVPRGPSVDKSGLLRHQYPLGPDDEITVFVPDAPEEFPDKPVSIGSDGYIKLPLIGRVDAQGKTLDQLDQEITARLSKYYKDPQVVVKMGEFRSQPVTVVGMVANPGLQQLKGQRTLVEVISLAGGLKPDAGNIVNITRKSEWGNIPVPGSTSDPAGNFNSARIPYDQIVDGKHPEFNIAVKPYDVISVSKGQLVYVMGEVQKAGGFVLKERESMSVLEAVAMAGGSKPMANTAHALLLRANEGDGMRKQIPVNISAIEKGTSPDIRMDPEDVLMIPNNTKKVVMTRLIETAIGVSSGILIWQRW